MLANYPPLFELEVVHGYFASPRNCRLGFEPDAAAAAWIKRTGCVVRSAANLLKVFYETSPGGGRPPLARTGAPVELTFTVRAADPLFSLYTAAFDPLFNLRGGDSSSTAAGQDLPVFDTAAARKADDGAWTLDATWNTGPFPPSGTEGLTAGRNVLRAFQVVVRLSGDLKDAGKRYRLLLPSRAMVWKYLVVGEWGLEPFVADAATDATSPPAAASDLVTFDRVEPAETLADGRKVVAFRSTTPIPLRDRPSRRFELRGRGDDANAARLLIKSLPVGDAANLALEDPADPTTLVCEIFVSR